MSTTETPKPTHHVGAPPLPARSSRVRRHLAVLLVLVGLVAAAPGVASLAGFTARAVNRDNVISTGALDIAFGRASKYVAISNMKPGDWLDQTIDITNTGTLASDYRFHTEDLRVRFGANLDDVLRATITRRGEVLVEGVRLSAVQDVTGRLEPDATDLLEVRISWPENTPEVDNRYQGAALEFDFVVDASQLETTTTTAPPTTAPPTTAPTTAPPTTVAGGLAINGVPGMTAIEVPFDPTVPGITIVSASSTRFHVTNTSTQPMRFRFESTGTTEVWDGSGEWIETIVSAEWGWDGYEVALAPGERRDFIANSWDATTKLSVVAIG